MIPLLFINIVVFLSAFLLFQIELIIAKIILPHYGGSYQVWGACLVFFQAALLLGYLYSHFSIKALGMGRYRYVHLFILLIPLLFFPGRPLPVLMPNEHIPAAIDIFFKLFISIGPVFFVLSTVSMVLQAWLSVSSLPQKRNPYFLYAVSNLGSFAALFSYPFFFESSFDLLVQLNIWRTMYVLLLVLQLLVFLSVPVRELTLNSSQERSVIQWPRILRWVLLGAAGVILFMAVTNIITTEIAPIPLLWILPFSIYLLSFVLNFKKNPWCPAWINTGIPAALAIGIFLYFSLQRRMVPYMVDLILLHVLLFVLCMFCQNRLYRLRPAEDRLIFFYVMISLGGFLGGMLVSWIIPLISDSLIEFLVGLWVISFVFIIGEEKIRVGLKSAGLILYFFLLLVCWPIYFKGYHFWAVMALVTIMILIFIALKSRPHALNLCLIAVICFSSVLEILWNDNFFIYRHRNYYGIHKIYERGGVRFLMHGTTVHGTQVLTAGTEMEPTAYYSHKTPVGEVLSSPFFKFNSIGAVGLGTGTLAVYLNEHQTIDFYELDPDVFTIANRHFTFLKKSHGQINYIFGDARLSMEKLPDKKYDIIIIDAFSSDAIPVHLLTTEAIEKYRKHLNDNGLILFHISNRYLKLAPVLLSNARKEQAFVCGKQNTFGMFTYASIWTAMTWSVKTYGTLVDDSGWLPEPTDRTIKSIRPWSDNYSNILSVFNVKDQLSQIKSFNPFSR